MMPAAALVPQVCSALCKDSEELVAIKRLNLDKNVNMVGGGGVGASALHGPATAQMQSAGFKRQSTQPGDACTAGCTHTLSKYWWLTHCSPSMYAPLPLPSPPPAPCVHRPASCLSCADGAGAGVPAHAQLQPPQRDAPAGVICGGE